MGSATIAGAIERAIADGELAPGARLPAVRDLARELEVSPATVAAAYRTLKERGIVSANRGRGTAVANQPPLRIRSGRRLPPGTRDLASGNPDPALLPPLAPAFARLDPQHKLYGGPIKLPWLVELATHDFAGDGITGDIAIAGGALDGMERALQTQLRPGDRVVVEDPSWPRIADLLSALSLQPEPVRVDDHGLIPAELERALGKAKAVIATPRGQNPTGAALDRSRAARLRETLANHPDTLVIEDDFLGPVAGAPYHPLHGPTDHWAVIRSLAKPLGPDLRIAPIAGDALTISRIEGRQLLGTWWVSHIVQQTAAHLWASATTTDVFERAERAYAERRAALLDALQAHDIEGHGRTGLFVWVPLDDEFTTIQLLLERGWAVSPGERHRFTSPPGIRITTSALEPAEAGAFAQALAEALHGSPASYAG